VISREQPAGVQVGELIRVTREGFDALHAAPRGFFGHETGPGCRRRPVGLATALSLAHQACRCR